MDDKKISELRRTTALQGDEIVPFAKGGDNGAFSMNTAKTFMQNGMVKEVSGKGLSTNDYTTEDKQKLSALPTSTELADSLKGKVDAVKGKGLSTNDYTDADKSKLAALPTGADLIADLGEKVDAVSGKGLSTNDYTDKEKQKLAALPTNENLSKTLDTKLDKEVWDERNEQFSIVGEYVDGSGLIRKGNPSGIARTVYLPLNNRYPISISTITAASHLDIAFFDSAYNFISGKKYDRLASVATNECAVNEFPESAAFFIVSTYYVDRSRLSWSNGPTSESREGATSEAIAASKLALFIDQWNSACGTFGKYDLVNAPDAEHPFYLNELWLTYEEALAIYNDRPRIGLPLAAVSPDVRTNLLQYFYSGRFLNGDADLRGAFCYATKLEVARVLSNISVGDFSVAFCNCPALRKIVEIIRLDRVTSTDSCFKGCAKLELVRLNALTASISFSDSPLLSLASLQYLVANAVNTSAITVTVHADVYAKLTTPDIETEGNYVANSQIRLLGKSQWELLAKEEEHIWNSVNNAEDFSIGDIMVVAGDVSDESGVTGICYGTVSGVDGKTITTTDNQVFYDSWYEVLVRASIKNIQFATA